MAARFLIQDEALRWLDNVVTPLKSDTKNFEVFYLCALAGLITYRKTDVTNALTREATDNFPGEYTRRSRLIVGLFLSREMKFRRIGLEEKGPLHRAIAEYVDPRSPSQLSDTGVKELNRYAFGGYERILEWFREKPADLESFLPHYHRKLNEVLQAEPLAEPIAPQA